MLNTQNSTWNRVTVQQVIFIIIVIVAEMVHSHNNEAIQMFIV